MSTATTPLAYPTTALDRGLRLIQLVRDVGSIRVMDAADELGISRSSAHRLLQALVYRDFLTQNEDHVYEAGPAISARPVDLEWVRGLRRTAQPHMDGLVRTLGHASNLMMHVDSHVRFIKCVTFAGGTYDRSGSLMMAHRTAGGRALLAHVDDETLESTYASAPGLEGRSPSRQMGSPVLSTLEFSELMHKVERVRKVDFSVSRAEVERSVSAVGTVVRDSAGRPLAALTVSARTPGAMTGDDLMRSVDRLFAARQAIEQDLARAS